ncbi:MAG: arylsulfotransferase family protein [Candidatus Omnitrophota bacterium]|nr:arylsulfotransferase family protein [Candidatus Omnitrophota bacterium]
MKRILKELFIVISFFYAAAILGNIYLFELSFAVLTFWLVATIFRLLIRMLTFIFSEKYTKTFRVIIFLFIFFIYGGLILNIYFFPKKYSPISIVGDIAFFIFTLFLGWVLLKKINRILYVSLGVATFSFFIFLWLTYATKIFGQINVSEIDALKSLPYAVWTPAEKTINYSSVTKYDPAKAYNGINIYATNNLSEAYLMDMRGNILHTWSAKIDKNDNWYVIQLDKKGDLFVIPLKDRIFFKLDWDSNIKWQKRMIAHHDIAISEEGDIYILSRNDKFIFKYGLPLPIVNDYIIIFSPAGKVKREIYLYDIFKTNISLQNVIQGYLYMFTHILSPKTFVDLSILSKTIDERIEILNKIKFDVFHDNTIQIIDRDIKGLCKNGNLLLSLRNMDLIAIIDIEKEKILWQWGPGIIEMQHQPALLENNNILVFDNGTRRGYSRIIEVNPLTRQIVWEYKTKNPQDFFSAYEGSCQRLPNGNTLICESNRGRALEVTKSGEIVWEFYNPEVDKENKKRAGIYRFMRITTPQEYPILKKLLQVR